MIRRLALVLLAAAAFMFSSPAAHAAENGWFGFALAIDAEGILNPKLRSIKIEKVFPASPAAKAGLAEGDMIVELPLLVPRPISSKLPCRSRSEKRCGSRSNAAQTQRRTSLSLPGRSLRS
jgi:hypothetical protein